MKWHVHSPAPTGRHITAGFRKDNLPNDAWTFVCEGDEMECQCGCRFIRTRQPERIVELVVNQ